MRILTVLTYYRPHTSGLTIYAERLAKALVRRGHQVTVLTSQYDRSLPREEIVDGVRIVRAPVAMRVSKGVIMPTFGFLATRLVLSHDVVHLHLPQFDAAGIALRGRLFRKPTVITYHCDLRMPPGLIAWLANQAVLVMNELAALFTHRMVTYTQDYADHSAYLRRYRHKLQIIPPPVELPEVSLESIQAFGQRNNPDGNRPVIGMAARFATEKGVEVLLDALPRILEVYPRAQVHFAGPYQNIVGEEHYFQRLAPRIQAFQAQGHWRFLGVLNPEDMARFYPNIDVLVLPSLNSTEAFGLVQIEAMMNGVPCVASDLPGVRQPVLRHQMGRIAPVGDSQALAEAILEVLNHREQFVVDRDAIRQQYHPDAVAARFETLFQGMLDELQ
jgi:glycosyltransferase involved in cell wall biosynthesis